MYEHTRTVSRHTLDLTSQEGLGSIYQQTGGFKTSSASCGLRSGLGKYKMHKTQILAPFFNEITIILFAQNS